MSSRMGQDAPHRIRHKPSIAESACSPIIDNAGQDWSRSGGQAAETAPAGSSGGVPLAELVALDQWVTWRYDRDRFFTVTGRHLASTPTTIEERGAELRALHAELFPPKPSRRVRGPSAASSLPPPLPDEAVIQAAVRSRNGAKFVRLFHGHWQGRYASQSEADLAFCNMLRFWTRGNREQMDRLFRRSGLMRDKWDEPRGDRTYGQMTIDKALESGSAMYAPACRSRSTGSTPHGASPAPRAATP